ncbi:MAG: hypothetical protein ACI4PF_03785 [Christensenellales bacterium]
MKKYKLKETLYHDADYESVENYKVDNKWRLFAKKGQIAERFVLNEELREEYCIDDDPMWKIIYIFNNGNYILCQDEYSDYFEEVKNG